MRKRFELQLETGVTPIEEINVPVKSRDELPPVLRALQYIYTESSINEDVFKVLEQKIRLTDTGRPGMNLWEILVLGVVRLTLNINYDRLEYTANTDMLLRQFLGINDLSGFNVKRKEFALQTLKDNVCLLTEEVFEEINQIVVVAGHNLCRKKKDGEDEPLNVKFDTYPLGTNVHFPTDISLLWDSVRKSIDAIGVIADYTGNSGWREAKAWKRKTKNAYNSVNRLCKSGGKNKKRRLKKKTRKYLAITRVISEKIDISIAALPDTKDVILRILLQELSYYKALMDKHVDLVKRRLLQEEKIPHEEKLFSIFEPHTEWINKGKSGRRIDLGLNVLVGTDQYGFCVHYHVCEKEQDVALAVPSVEAIKKKYNRQLGSVSFDRGFWSPVNYRKLEAIVPQVIMPKKGKRNKAEQDREGQKDFKVLRCSHATIESDINSLEHHGLDRCPDRGIDRFKRYVGLGILSFNLHRLGNTLLALERKQKKRRTEMLPMA